MRQKAYIIIIISILFREDLSGNYVMMTYF